MTIRSRSQSSAAGDSDVDDRTRLTQRQLTRDRRRGLDRPDAADEPRIAAELELRRGYQQDLVLQQDRHHAPPRPSCGSPALSKSTDCSLQVEDRMTWSLCEPLLVARFEAHVEERPGHASELVVAPEHGNGLTRGELHDATAARGDVLYVDPPGPRPVRSSPSSGLRRARRATARRLPRRSRPVSTRTCPSCGRER